MNEPRQKQFLAIGKEGCLFLSLIWHAENETGTYIDAYMTYLNMLARGLILENCYVNDIGKVFSLLMGNGWDCFKQEMDYQRQGMEKEITRMEKRPTPTVTSTHFVCTDGAGKVTYDPLSLDLSTWTPAKKYILRRKS